jgi:lipid A disaccharide synthetase
MRDTPPAVFTGIRWRMSCRSSRTGLLRAALGLPAAATVVAVLPGSRRGELRLGEAFAGAMDCCGAGRACVSSRR